MPTLYVANFDLDDRLAKPRLTTLPKALRAIDARLAPLLEPLCEPGDAVALPGDRVADAGRFDRVEPWGVEPRVLGWLAAVGVRADVLDRLPDPAAVRAVNGRRWQFAAEGEVGVRRAGSVLCGTAGDAFAAADRLGGPWVMKREFGGSGRGVLFGDGRPAGRLTAWLAASPRGQAVGVEPRQAFDAEFSAHFTVTEGGVTFDGVCLLHSTPRGQFQRVEPTGLTPPLTAALPVWEAVAERARAAGYRGPLGIDAGFAGGRVVRPVMDVNARWSMGRVALVTGRAVANPSSV